METTTQELKETDFIYKLKHIYCHDPACTTCNDGKGHGPYWHAIFEVDGRKQTIFLGKEFKPLDQEGNSPEKKVDEKRTQKSFEKKTDANKAVNEFWFHRITPSKKSDRSQSHVSKKRDSNVFSCPPSKADFENDLKRMQATLRMDSLKSVYRSLTKKYHPDKYPGVHHVSTWMAEINGRYAQLKKSSRF